MKKSICIFVLLGLFALVVSSCQTHENEQGDVVDLCHPQDVAENQVFSNVQVMALEDKDGNYLSNVQELVSEDGYLIVLDSKGVLFVYTADGKYVSDSKNKIGHGGNEFSIITAWTYNRYTKNIEIVTPLHLLSYDIHFNLKKKVKLPTRMATNNQKSIIFCHIFDLSENLHILIPTLVSQDAYTYLLFDSFTSQIVRKYNFESDAKVDVNMQEQCFFDGKGSEISFVPPFMAQYIYTFDKEMQEFSKKYRLLFGKDVLTEDDVRKFGDNDKQKQSFLLNTDKEIPVSCFDASEYLAVFMKKGRKLSDCFTLFYDKSSKQVARVNQFTDKKMSFPLVKYADANCLYASVDGKALDGILEHLNKQGIKVEANKQEKGSIYVLKYYLK